MKTNPKVTATIVAALAAALLGAGCGSGSSSTAIESTANGAAGAAAHGAAGGGGQGTAGSEGVPSEAQSAATGDIPDNQVFLSFSDPRAGYAIRYPEGWARNGNGDNVTFSEKANVIHLVVRPGPAPTRASAESGVRRLRRADATVKANPPQELTIKGRPVVKTTYTRLSRPDPVTGKRLRLVVDRYEYGRGGRVAVLDLGTPEGVDNVDAYRMISESFRWR